MFLGGIGAGAGLVFGKLVGAETREEYFLCALLGGLVGMGIAAVIPSPGGHRSLLPPPSRGSPTLLICLCILLWDIGRGEGVFLPGPHRESSLADSHTALIEGSSSHFP